MESKVTIHNLMTMIPYACRLSMSNADDLRANWEQFGWNDKFAQSRGWHV